MNSISFLILTHNRPKLFNRCITSILSQIPDNISWEILVNNDSNDITEIQNSCVKYYYHKSDNLSDLYKMLFDKAINEYVYILEDDDYLVPDFFSKLEKYRPSDLYYMNYKTWNINLTMNRRKESFKIEQYNQHFQLSQILFRKQMVIHFPNDNALNNDWKLFQTILSQDPSICIIPEYMFIQSTDGNDNISFPNLNKDIRWNIQNKVVLAIKSNDYIYTGI